MKEKKHVKYPKFTPADTTGVALKLTDPLPTPPPDSPVDPEAKSKKKTGDRDSTIGSKRGVETMLRSAYRTNLDMNALADNKANMLISVNGLILSVMIATGGLSVFFSASFVYVIPMVALAITSFGAMVFAILVARPRVDFSWQPTTEHFRQDQANPFLFLHFHNLTQDEYLEVINDVLQDRDRLYHHMVTHNYGMGVILARKFRLLRWSYNVFMVGLGVTLSLFIGVHGWAKQDTKIFELAASAPSRHELTQFQDIYEPSGVLALADNKVLLIEDEAGTPLKIATFSNGQASAATPVIQPAAKAGAPQPLDIGTVSDLEAIDGDRRGNIYVITSHSRPTGNGASDAARFQFLRLRLDGGRITDLASQTSLLPQLAAAYPALLPAIAQKNVKRGNGFNIEGLALNALQTQLLIGLRSPLTEGEDKALIAVLENPEAVFSQDAPMRFAKDLITLDLQQGGIRALRYIPKLGGYLIISGRASAIKVPFRLWFWDGEPTHAARAVDIAGVSDLGKAEGISTITVEGKERLLIVSDDGDTVRRQAGHYLLLDYDQLDY